jgi:hypothetical protein
MMNPTEWDWIRDGTCDDPPVNGWFAVWVSYGESEDDMNFEAWQFLNGEPVAFSVAILLAKAGPFPDETTAEAWADAHNPYWTD